MANRARDAAFVVMIPLAGALFAATGRHPVVGIAASFAGVAGGFSANLLPGQLDALLVGITQPAAQLLDPGWKMNIAGNWYCIVGMTFIMVPLGGFITGRIVAPRFGDWTPTAETLGRVALPVLVPMLMLMGISPEMTTAAFRMGDSVTNPITPLMVHFPLVLAFCQRWIPQFGMGSLIAAMLP